MSECDLEGISPCGGALYRFIFRNLYRCGRHIRFCEAWSDVAASEGYCYFTKKAFKHWLGRLTNVEMAAVLRRRVSKRDWEKQAAVPSKEDSMKEYYMTTFFTAQLHAINEKAAEGFRVVAIVPLAGKEQENAFIVMERERPSKSLLSAQELANIRLEDLHCSDSLVLRPSVREARAQLQRLEECLYRTWPSVLGRTVDNTYTAKAIVDAAILVLEDYHRLFCEMTVVDMRRPHAPWADFGSHDR